MIRKGTKFRVIGQDHMPIHGFEIGQIVKLHWKAPKGDQASCYIFGKYDEVKDTIPMIQYVNDLDVQRIERKKK